MGSELDTELAYLAGVFDGEGCVTAHRSKKNSDVNYPKLSVCMTDQAPLKLFQKHFGGGIWERKAATRRNPNYKIQYEWIVRCAKALESAAVLARFSRVKKPQLDLVQKLGRPTQRGVPLSPETRAINIEVTGKLKTLKGVPVHD